MRSVIIVQNISTLLNMVNDNIGVGIISRHPLSSSQDGFCIRELIPSVKFDIGVFAANLNELTPVERNLFDERNHLTILKALKPYMDIP